MNNNKNKQIIVLATILIIVGIILVLIRGDGADEGQSSLLTQDSGEVEDTFSCQEYKPGDNSSQVEASVLDNYSNLEELVQGADVVALAQITGCIRGDEAEGEYQERYVEYQVDIKKTYKGPLSLGATKVRVVALYKGDHWQIPLGYPSVTEGQTVMLFMDEPFDGVLEVIGKGGRLAHETSISGIFEFRSTKWPSFSAEDF